MPKDDDARKHGAVPETPEPLESTGPDNHSEFHRLVKEIDLRQLRYWVSHNHNVKNFAAADELVAEAVTRALEATPRFRDSPTFPQVLTYVQTTLKRLAWEWHQRESGSIVEFCADPAQHEMNAPGMRVAESLAVLQKDAELILRAIHTLTSRGREVLYMWIYEDLSVPEIATRLRLDETTVWRHLKKALEQLRAEISSQGRLQ